MSEKPIPRRLRFEILRRDGHTCRYCGAQAPDVPLTVDHVIPRVLGGADDPTNLVTACQDCNAGKASTSPDEHIVDDVNRVAAEVDAAALLFRRAMDVVAKERRSEVRKRGKAIAEFGEAWTAWAVRHPDGRVEHAPRDDAWEVSVGRFYDLGLDLDMLRDLVTAAMQKKGVTLDGRWRYFCGCCWRELSDRQERARRHIEDGVV